ncbi:MAG: hypothetical protein HY263_10435 [Chloroflexi bacterium]|nr:hypothetical protein [Chloroflexota bacterium]
MAVTLIAVAAVGIAVMAAGSGPVRRALDAASDADRSARANQALADRSAALVLAPVDVRSTVSADGSTILSVHLTARVYATRSIVLGHVTGEAADPVFRLTAPRSVGVVGTYQPLPGELRANAVTDVALTFDLRGLSAVPEAGRTVASVGAGPPTPGIWLLQMDLVDAAGLTYRASTFVMVVAAA